MNLRIKLLLIHIFLLWVVGCGPSLVTEENTDDRSSEIVLATPAASVEDGDTSLSTSLPHLLPTVLTTATVISISPTVTAQAISTDVPVTTDTVVPGGTLWIDSFDAGLLSVSVETGEIKQVVPKTSAWLLTRFAVSPDKQRMAYWIHTTEKSELWVSDLVDWMPELIFTVPDLDPNAGTLWWISNDYLSLEPGSYTPPFYLPLHAYIINMNSKQVEMESRSFNFGCLLARSPQTDEIATWCPARENWNDAESFWRADPSYYVVIEEEGFLWTTEDPPQEKLAELKTNQDNWGWSSDRQKVAFPLYDELDQRVLLHVVERRLTSSVRLKDPASWYSYFRDTAPWSPNTRYLAYIGDCSGQECYRIMDVESQEVVWTSQNVPEAQHLRGLVWSDDSEYVSLLTDKEVFIIYLHNNEVVKQLPAPSGYVLTWLQ